MQLPLPQWLRHEVARHGAPSILSSWWIGFKFARMRREPASRTLSWIDHGPCDAPARPLREVEVSAKRVQAELSACGGSLLEIETDRGGLTQIADSPFERRITGETGIEMTGPLAGDPLLQTSADPSGRLVRGLLGSRGAVLTPWATVLTAEHDFDRCFANGMALCTIDLIKAALYARLPAPSGPSERAWERIQPRFDLAVEPNEYARFGYVVEIDPYDPSSAPRKHSALGRFKHRVAAPVLTRDRRVVLYSSDGARNECVYKFVSEREYDPCNRRENLRLLERGTLYAAKLEPGGSGRWLALGYGRGPLTDANGFHSQAEILANARGAADLLGATKVGGALEIAEEGGDDAALRFRWQIALRPSERPAGPFAPAADVDRAAAGTVARPSSAA
jgi:hypothetical protein